MDKPTYEHLLKAYNTMATDLYCLWRQFKPNETYITENFIRKAYLNLTYDKNRKVENKKRKN